MRKYKFRGVGIQGGKWFYGDLSTDKGVGIVFREEGILYSWNVKPETVGQYAGINDKNGKEIYEGDIVREFQEDFDGEGEDYNQVGIVKFYGGSFYLDNDSEDNWSDDSEFEIIGNIHENIDILENK